jgi:hypothetical protein
LLLANPHFDRRDIKVESLSVHQHLAIRDNKNIQSSPAQSYHCVIRDISRLFLELRRRWPGCASHGDGELQGRDDSATNHECRWAAD